MSTPPAVGFKYRVSRFLIAATIVVAILALLAVWISGIPHWLDWALTLFVVASAGVALDRLLRPRVRSLLWRGDGGVEISLNDGQPRGQREVQGGFHSSRVMGPLIVLALRWPPRERATLWLLPDNLDTDTRRRLRMRLGTGAGGSASGNADSG